MPARFGDGRETKETFMTKPKDKVQGEGDEAGRRFQDAERSFVEKGLVEEKARDADGALEGLKAPSWKRRAAAAPPAIHGTRRTHPTRTPRKTSTTASMRRFQPATPCRSRRGRIDRTEG
jgi:hypothetical protein